jgi:hypothetical protein
MLTVLAFPQWADHLGTPGERLGLPNMQQTGLSKEEFITVRWSVWPVILKVVWYFFPILLDSPIIVKY